MGVLVALYSSWRATATFDRQGAELIVEQRANETVDGADVRAPAERASGPRDGRIYSGFRWNWGNDPIAVEPGVVAVDVSRGRHTVSFEYEPYARPARRGGRLTAHLTS